MILGVALVVNELDKGHRMVFRYPESIPSSVLASNSGLVKIYEQYFSMSTENLAKLFRPKMSLTNKVLEISIDDLCFLSYPCQCPTSDYEREDGKRDRRDNKGGTGVKREESDSDLHSRIGPTDTDNF
eukprot:CAMPEP_0173370408 /NCGR_PEP_ID=MMETSP1144-20121109/26675_1 /TAXON_ID=483371 /ORGANISM="non described non described, Strain CCMP2298" /LENGTH=127 /DNA_ID=CAMNT_0014321967 /DNA_START=24 /DNA_END=404 /DNA_ORIENTATION=+